MKWSALFTLARELLMESASVLGYGWKTYLRKADIFFNCLFLVEQKID